MQSNEPTPEPTPPEPTLPPRRSVAEIQARTWEVELLISGALIFALLQAPDIVDRWYLRLEPRLGGDADYLLFFAYYYVKLVVYTGAATFLLHLATRAYWVALLGLATAFPDGVRWEKLDSGPIGKALYRRRLGPIDEVIARADRIGSSIFTFGLLLCVLFVMSVVAVFAIRLVAQPLGALFGIPVKAVVISVGIVVLIPPIAAALIDKRWGARLDERRGVGRAVSAIVRFYYAAALMPLLGPLQLTLLTNVRKRVLLPMFAFALFGVVALFVADLFVLRDRVDVGNAAYVPLNAGARGIDPRFYDDLRRDALLYSSLPSIPGDVIRSPYLRLFLPYDADRDDELVADRCPDLTPHRTGALRTGRRPDPPADSVLDRTVACVAAIWTVRLDGQPVDVRYDFYVHPDTDTPGLVTYLPMAPLEPGRHVLDVEKAMTEEEIEDERPRKTYFIPFYR